MSTLPKLIFPIVALLLYFLFSCNQDSKPKTMLSDEEMVSVLVEMHMVEARADLLQISPDSLRPLLDERYATIFEDLGVDTAAFNSTFGYYEKNPGEMDSLYQKVVDRLVELEATYRTTSTDSTSVPDSTIAPEPVVVDSLPVDTVVSPKRFRNRTP